MIKRKFVIEVTAIYPEELSESLKEFDAELFYSIYSNGVENTMYADNENTRILYSNGLYKVVDEKVRITSKGIEI